MDKTKQYILMSEKAIEIQKIAKDNCYSLNKGYDAVMHFEEDLSTPIDIDGFHRGYWLWLPRQDQLQEMVGGTSPWLISKIYAFTNRIYSEKINIYTFSMEQLWLAFVMKEKYSKVWNGKDWIKDGK